MLRLLRAWRWSCGGATVVAAILGLSVSSAAWPEEPAARDPQLKARISGLIRELDANQRARRIHAERELLDLGPAILNELPAPELIANPSIRTSLSKVRKILELRKANESVQASLVTTPAGISLGDFFREVERQTSNRLNASALNDTQLQTAVPEAYANVPFWKALETAFAQTGTGADFRPDADAVPVVLKPTLKNQELAVNVSGPFRLSLASLKPRAIVGSKQRRLRAEFTLAPEPRLRALFLKFQAKDFSALTSSGKTLLPADPAAQLDLPLGEGGHHVRWNLDFLVPEDLPDDELKSPRITGMATMQIAASSEHVRFKDLSQAEGTARRRGGVTVSLLKIKASDQLDDKRSLAVRIQVAYDTGGPAFESHRTWIFHNQVYLDPLEGEQLPVNGGYETDLQANGTVGVTYRFQGVKQPLDQLQFVYVAPTLIIDVPVAIELKPPEPK